VREMEMWKVINIDMVWGMEIWQYLGIGREMKREIRMRT
jgi:hypothetical protein